MCVVFLGSNNVEHKHHLLVLVVKALANSSKAKVFGMHVGPKEPEG